MSVTLSHCVRGVDLGDVFRRGRLRLSRLRDTVATQLDARRVARLAGASLQSRSASPTHPRLIPTAHITSRDWPEEIVQAVKDAEWWPPARIAEDNRRTRAAALTGRSYVDTDVRHPSSNASVRVVLHGQCSLRRGQRTQKRWLQWLWSGCGDMCSTEPTRGFHSVAACQGLYSLKPTARGTSRA